ncbi:MAG: hypothetical protein IOB84_13690 [Brevundimonas sp.]|nr:hypothetical protein [Brevundimonas sp.]
MTPDGVEAHGTLVWNVAIEEGRTPWGHVLAFAAVDDQTWLVVDPHFRWTETYVLTRVQFDRWVVDLGGRARIWRIAGGRECPALAGPFCVGTIKRLIGLRSGAFTPAGLERDLRRSGATREFVR